MERKEIKAWAKENIKKRRWQVLGSILLVSVITGALNAAVEKVGNSLVGLILNFVVLVGAFVLQAGLVKFMIAVKNGEDGEISDVFSYFNKDIKNVLITGFMYTLMIFLFTLLFIIPGIIKSLAYSLVPYILADDPNRNYKEILDLSTNMMNGHKMELFVLGLSFIGWHILAMFTLGILEIWILPYQQLTLTKFLCDIKENYEKENKPAAKAVEA